MAWTTFWALFSQTHLVTLLARASLFFFNPNCATNTISDTVVVFLKGKK
jgi:hypothetical protein